MKIISLLKLLKLPKQIWDGIPQIIQNLLYQGYIQKKTKSLCGITQIIVKDSPNVIFEGPVSQEINIRFPESKSPPYKISRTAIDKDKFVGRDKDLRKLHRQLNEVGTLAITAVTGMGGVGKTELALQYTHRHVDKLGFMARFIAYFFGRPHQSIGSKSYPGGVLWLDARGVDIFKEILEFAATYLNFIPQDKQEQSAQVQACWNKWSGLFKGEKLLIIDDVTKELYQEIFSYIPKGYKDIKVIITTRLKLDTRIIKSLHLDVLDKNSAIELLKKLIGEERVERELEKAQLICERMGYLPLGLTLVGRYLNYLQADSLEDLLEELEEEGIDSGFMELIEEDSSLNIPFGDRQLYEGVYTVFNLSWKYLTKGGKQLGALLSLFDIPPNVWSMVEKVAPPIAEVRGIANNNLGDINLINGQERNPIHPLIQEFFIKKLREDDNFLDIQDVLFDNLVFQQYVYDTGYLENNLKQIEKIRDLLSPDKSNLKGYVILSKMIGHGYYADRSTSLTEAVDNMMLAHKKVIDVYGSSTEYEQKVWHWYKLFLLDHSHNLVATTPEGFINLKNESLNSQDLQSKIESLLPEQLKQIDSPLTPNFYTYVLRAAHYWGHRGNQVSYQLLKRIPNVLGGKNQDIKKLYDQGTRYYLLAAIFRAVNFRLSHPKKYQEHLSDLIQESPGTPQWLLSWNPVGFEDSVVKFEQFTSLSQAVGDTAHQYKGITWIKLWTYPYMASREKVDSSYVEETRRVMEITFKLWEKAKELLNKQINEKIIRYYAWTAPLETMVELIEAHSYNESLIDLEEVTRRVEEDMDKLEEKYKLTYPWARLEALSQTEKFHNILANLG
ncbi:NB-ARC domain-containing protein [Moorena sp. SIO3H5]|uniref:NB-ARC domain-containing protein n=1 Tax=Moorena sp. SIO3H5 TaxID=2607834 RepID=UPI0013B7FAE2|nr:NB-ARC domain-containing protein [Moorena sp. SIO3H5]NEO71894.1 hypothetical protein [Moorena sp. SIO3H5]